MEPDRNWLCLSSRQFSVNESQATGSKDDLTFRFDHAIHGAKGLILRHFMMDCVWYPVHPSYGSNYEDATDIIAFADIDDSYQAVQGIYTGDELAAQLTTQMSGDGGSVSYDSKTKKFTIQPGSSKIVSWSLDPGLGRLMGFDVSSNRSAATSHTSDWAARLYGPSHVVIDMSPCVNAERFMDTAQANAEGPQGTFIVPVDVSPGEVLTWSQNSQYVQSAEFNRYSFNTMRVRIKDENGKHIHTNGGEYFMVFEIIR